MSGIKIPENYRLVNVPPFMSLGVEGVTLHSATELIEIYRKIGAFPIDFGRVNNRGYCEFFKFGIYEPDVFVGTYAKFASFTKRNSDSVIITGVGESVLETMSRFMDNFEKLVGFEVKLPTSDFADDMGKSELWGLSEDTNGLSLQQRIEWYREKARVVVPQ